MTHCDRGRSEAAVATFGREKKPKSNNGDCEDDDAVMQCRVRLLDLGMFLGIMTLRGGYSVCS